MALSHAESLRGKFLHATVKSGPIVYAAEFSNGVVKVGYTRNARTRMSTVAGHARREYGATIVNFYVSKPHADESCARKSEYVLLARIAENGGTPIPRRAEFFSGISFADTVSICDAVTAKYLKSVSPTTPSPTPCLVLMDGDF